MWGLPVDHVVVAGPDLDRSCVAIERLTGLEAAPGGQHAGLGTRNRLIGLAGGSYLEIIGPDPGQPTPPGPRFFGIDDLSEPRLAGVAFRASSKQLDDIAAAADRVGASIVVTSMSRQRPGGATLTWRVARLRSDPVPGVLVFLIDWMSSRHPAEDLVPAARIEQLEIVHPRPIEVKGAWACLGVSARPVEGAEPRLVATLSTPRGLVQLS